MTYFASRRAYALLTGNLLLVCLFTILLELVPVLQERVVFIAESPLLALVSRVRSPGSFVASDVVIVDIDQESLDTYGPWPWKRALTARLIEAIAAANAKAIGVTIVFAEPSEISNDTALDLAIRSAGNVVLGYVRSVTAGPLFPRSEQALLRQGLGGFLDLHLDTTGSVIGTRTVVRSDGHVARAFPIVLAERFDRESARRAEDSRILRPNFYGGGGALQHLSAVRVLSKKGLEPLRGKLVVLDVNVSPLPTSTLVGPLRSGEVYATIAQNILHNNSLRFSWALNLVLGGAGVLILWVSRRKKVPALTLVGGYFVLSYLVFLPRGMVTSTLSFMLALALCYWLTTKVLQPQTHAARGGTL